MSGSADRIGRRRWSLAIVVAALLAGAVWALSIRGDRIPEVRTLRPTTGELEAAVVADGVLSYRSEVALTSEVLGAVASIEVTEGDRVERGDVLMRLDAERFRAQRAQREAGLQAERQAVEARAAERERARVRHERYRALRAQQLVSAEDLEQAALERARTEAAYREIGFRVEAQRALLAETMEQLRKTEIRSPIAGVILSIDIAPGETAVPSTLSFSGSTVARIADVSRLNATARLSEFDIWKLAPGAPARVVVPALNDAELQGTVRSVAMAPVNAAPGQGGTLAAAYEVVVDIDGAAHSGLRTGMACRIEFPRGDGRPRMTLPAEAVTPDRDDPSGRRGFVLVAEDGVLVRRPVVLGASAEGRREVVGGLSAEARVVTPAAAERLRPGDRIRARDDAAR